jgi:hypothetical protein
MVAHIVPFAGYSTYKCCFFRHVARSGACFAPLGFCCLPVICSGPPKFSLWGPKTGATAAELEALSDRMKSKEQRGRLALVVNNYVARRRSRCTASTASTKPIVARFFCLLCGGREQAHACISLRFSQRAVRVDQHEGPSLEHTLDIPESLQGYRTVLPHQVQLLLELAPLSPTMFSRSTPCCSGSCKYCALLSLALTGKHAKHAAPIAPVQTRGGPRPTGVVALPAYKRFSGDACFAGLPSDLPGLLGRSACQ